MKKKIFTVLTVIVMTTILTSCSSLNRLTKSFYSDMSGGINRKITVYSNTGNEIKSWSGKFDVSYSENEVFFDIDEKRVIIHGGIVINEEIKND